MKKIIHYIITFVMQISLINAQSVSSFTVNAIGAFSSGYKASSLALTINKSTECFQLNTGLSLYSGILGNMQFEVNCKSYSPTLPVEIKLYPNPVVNYTRLVSNSLLANTSQLQLIVMDGLGRAVVNKQISSSVLFAGVSLYFGQLPSGNYFLKLDGESLHHVIPFIKVK